MKTFFSKLSQVVSYFSIVTPLFRSAEFITERSIIYLCFWKNVFITKPTKTKHITEEIRENYLYQMIKFPYQVCEKPVATNNNAISCDI